MTPKLKALMVSLGIGLTITVGGLVSTREFWAPRIGVLDPALVDAGILLDCPLRNIRAWLVNPNGRMITQESKARVCNGEPVVSRLARDAIASGWRIYFVRDLGAATGSETELATVTDGHVYRPALAAQRNPGGRGSASQRLSRRPKPAVPEPGWSRVRRHALRRDRTVGGMARGMPATMNLSPDAR
jgi:hypothetical protein